MFLHPRADVARVVRLRNILADILRIFLRRLRVLRYKDRMRAVFVPPRFYRADFPVFLKKVIRDGEKYAVELVLLALVKAPLGAVHRAVYLRFQYFKLGHFARQGAARVFVGAVPRRIPAVFVCTAAAVCRRVCIALVQQVYARQIVTTQIAVHPLAHRHAVRAFVVGHAELVKQVVVIARTLVAEYDVELFVIVGLALVVIRYRELRFVQLRIRDDLCSRRVVQVQIQRVVVAHIGRV